MKRVALALVAAAAGCAGPSASGNGAPSRPATAPDGRSFQQRVVGEWE